MDLLFQPAKKVISSQQRPLHFPWMVFVNRFDCVFKFVAHWGLQENIFYARKNNIFLCFPSVFLCLSFMAHFTTLHWSQLQSGLVLHSIRHFSPVLVQIWLRFTLNPPLFTNLGPNLVTFYLQFHQSWSKSGYVLLTISPILASIFTYFLPKSGYHFTPSHSFHS